MRAVSPNRQTLGRHGYFFRPRAVLFVHLVLRPILGVDLAFNGGAEPLIATKAEDDQDSGYQDGNRIQDQPDILLALAENHHQRLDENRDRDGRNELGEAAPGLGSKAHLAAANDFLFDEILGDVDTAIAITT